MRRSTDECPSRRLPRRRQTRGLEHLQICKHWSHKFAVEFTPESGREPFSDDRLCDFSATDDALTMRIRAGDEATLERTQNVVVDHLKRFAFREDFGDIRWTRL
ncbi:hypothetical protein CAK95_22100 [Pseudorhodoplanes sinuspersici]|uniref:2,4-dihydroxyhept-2-ene-1,7-dioic acid aldolase n=1 Tax=Pseudorhodoplanes sinuspersici TaxID=1235591 RepID=A0A1W7A0M2_9HYPH|nr:hypothetical protein CAK95_22100 [Pseudorhodoplanes sinuspersici]